MKIRVKVKPNSGKQKIEQLRQLAKRQAVRPRVDVRRKGMLTKTGIPCLYWAVGIIAKLFFQINLITLINN